MALSMLIKRKLITLGTVQWYFEDGTLFSVPADEVRSIDLSNYTPTSQRDYISLTSYLQNMIY